MHIQLVYIHCVFFSGNGRYRIDPSWRGRVNRQLAAVLRQLKHQAVLVSCLDDQLHVVMRLSSEASIEEVAGRLRENSLRMINDVLQERGRFCWAPGYKAESVGWRDLAELARTIKALDRSPVDDFNEAYQELPLPGKPVAGSGVK